MLVLPHGHEELELVIELAEGPTRETAVGVRVDSERGWEGLVRVQDNNVWRTANTGMMEFLGGEDRQALVFQERAPHVLPWGLALKTRVYAYWDRLPRYDGEGEKIGAADHAPDRGGSLPSRVSDGTSRLIEAGLRREFTRSHAFELQGIPDRKEDYTSLVASGYYLRRGGGRGSARRVDLRLRGEWGITGLGGDRAFRRYEADLGAEVGSLFGGLLGGRVQVGVQDRDLTAPRQFRLGGPSSLIGLREEELLGQARVAGRIYHEIPVLGPLAVRVLADAGWVWDTPEDMRLREVRGSVGAGLRVDLPAGPLTVDFGRAAGGRDLWTFALGFPFTRPW